MLLTLIISWLIFNEHPTELKAESAEKRIIGGKTAGAYQFPFYVQMERPIIKRNKTWQAMCGASLIGPQWILTAAHCFPETSDEQLELIKNRTLVTYMGSTKRFNENADINIIIQVYLHPNFYYHEKPLIVLNDIAVAKLERPYRLSRNIQTVAIASKGSPKRCRRGRIVGIGRISRKPLYGEYVRYAEIISKEKYEISDKLKPSETIFVSKVFNKGNYAYMGDSGSPFICYFDNIAVQYGIFSYYKTTAKTVVTAFETIDKFMDFILTFVPEVSVYKGQKILKINKAAYLRSGIENKTREVFFITYILICWFLWKF